MTPKKFDGSLHLESPSENIQDDLLVKPKRQARQGWAEAIREAIDKGQVDVDHEWLEAGSD